MPPVSGKPLSGQTTPRSQLLFIILTAFVFVANSETKNSNTITFSPAHTLAKASCSSTLYPELCYSSIAESLDNNVQSPKDVIFVSLNVTVQALKRNHLAIDKFLDSGRAGNLTKREKTALEDCKETIEDSVDEIHAAMKNLRKYPLNKSLKRYADDLKTLLSSAITNQETCLDGFSYGDNDKHVREVVVGGQVVRVEKLCSNSLAMICNMTNTDLENEAKLNGGRKLWGEGNSEFPDWLSAGDRRLLQAGTVRPNVVVAADGTGNYRTVSAAVAAAPARSRTRYVIRIKAGVYRENVEVPKTKTNIMFVGDGRRNTIITARRNVVDGSTTFQSATVAVVGERFLARDITFQNSAGPSKHQAVALRVGSDLSAFYRCDILAYQDTLYVHTNRHFFVQCLIAGTVDFIFGNGATIIQDCDIHARRPDANQRNMVTAQGRTDPNQNTGIVLHRCRIGATSDLQAVQRNFNTYLGRPWKEYSRTVIMHSTISNVIHPQGWHEWDGNYALRTLYYGEYRNTGPGAVTSSRVSWGGHRVITSVTEAQRYTAANFISGGSWLSSTGFPFSLGF